MIPAAVAAAVIAVASTAGAGAATRATMSAPATIALNGQLTVHASGLVKGRYAVYIGFTLSHPKGGQAVVCSSPVGSARKVSGRATFSGKLPAFLGCRTRAGPLLSTVKTTPKHYTLVLGVPIGGGAFDGSASFVSRTILVTP